MSMSIFLFLICFFKLNSSPLKIYIDTSYFDNEYSRTDISKTIIFNALDKAKKTLEKLIEVKNEDTSLITIGDIFSGKVSEHGFYSSLLNSTLLNDGINAHLLILFRGLNTNSDSVNDCIDKIGIIKYKDGDNNKNRPIVGYIVFDTTLNIKIIENNDIYKEEYLSTLFLHQITHILGFNRNTITSSGKMSITNQTIMRTGKPIQKEIISSNNLKAEAKKYFNCETGLDLEDANPNNCDNNFIHWDERILLGDYMTYDINDQEHVISKFTLIVLEETGFYNVHYYTGGLMKFGKNAGCDFFIKDCNDPLTSGQTDNTKRKSNFENEFCSSRTKTTCSSARLSRGLCDNYKSSEGMVNNNNPYKRENWGTENYGNELADYCPISLNEKEIESKSNKNYIGNCKIGMKEGYGKLNFFYWDEKKNYSYSLFDESYGEKFSDISFCAFSSVIHQQDPNKGTYKGFIRPTCYEMYCSNQSLTIKISNNNNNQYIVCPKEGGFVNIGGKYEGHLLCPDYNLICDQSKPCNNLFDCVNLNSTEKGLSDDYLKKNVSMEIRLPGSETIFNKSYELANDGQCPLHCSECYENKKCFECDPDYPYYIGKKNNDNNPIICNQTINTTGYYNTTIDKNKVYFECLEKCLYCTEEKKCNGCDPKYYLGTNREKCEEQILGCKTYNETSLIDHDPKNGNYPGYKECKECDYDRSFYCVDKDKQNCIKINVDEYYTNE